MKNETVDYGAMSASERRAHIARALESAEGFAKSDRAHANVFGVSHKTVGRARARLVKELRDGTRWLPEEIAAEILSMADARDAVAETAGPSAVETSQSQPQTPHRRRRPTEASDAAERIESGEALNMTGVLSRMEAALQDRPTRGSREKRVTLPDGAEINLSERPRAEKTPLQLAAMFAESGLSVADFLDSTDVQPLLDRMANAHSEDNKQITQKGAKTYMRLLLEGYLREIAAAA